MTNTVQQLNDRLRRSFIGGKILITPGVGSLPDITKVTLLAMITTFDEFTEDNDPYSEHDFGSVTYEGVKVFWKIDYYNKTMDEGSPDPADPGVTTRVLTIMLAEEY